MTDFRHGPIYTPAWPRFSLRDLSRVAAWGLVALGALTLAALAASTELGKDRLILAVANFRGVPPPERLARTPADVHNRRLTQTLRELASDRIRLASRIDALERNVGDMTSSADKTPVAPIIATRWPFPMIAAPAAQPATAAPFSAPAPARSTPSEQEPTGSTPPIPAPDVPLPRAAAPQSPPLEEAATEAARPEFGVDLGRANSIEGLRQLWNAVKGRHGNALEGLRPVVALREIPRTNGVEVRLVAGPIPNAAAAARLCASLPGVTCHPTVFEGQKLALR
jgi:hypothetical protein